MAGPALLSRKWFLQGLAGKWATAGQFCLLSVGYLGGADCLSQLGFRALRNYFMHT